MPYRAPELFDVPSDATIDERTDIFSLGATLYAMGFYYSPFECTYQDATQRVVECSYLRVIGGAQFPPDKAGYSAAFVELINWIRKYYIRDLMDLMDGSYERVRKLMKTRKIG